MWVEYCRGLLIMADDSNVQPTLQTDYMQWLMRGVQDKGCYDHVEALVPNL